MMYILKTRLLDVSYTTKGIFETNKKVIWKTEPTHTPWLSGEEGTVELLKEWKTEMESQRRSLYKEEIPLCTDRFGQPVLTLM